MKNKRDLLYMLAILAFGALYVYFPLIGTLSALAAAVAVCVLAYSGGLLWALLSVALVCGLRFAVRGGWAETAFMLADFALPGLLAALALRRVLSLRGTVAAVAGGYLAEMVANFFVVKAVKGVNIFEQYIDSAKQGLTENRAELIKMLQELGYANVEQYMDEITKLYNSIFDAFKQLAPAFMVIAACLMAYTVIVFAAALLRRRGEELAQIIPFRRIRGTKRLAAAFAVSLLLALLGEGVFSGIFVNITLLLMSYFTVCGLAVLDFYVEKRIKPAIARVLLYIGIIGIAGGFSVFVYIVNPTLVLLVTGIIDGVFDIRKLEKRGEPFEQ